MRKMFWKMATCMAIVLLSFSVYSCGDDDDEKGSVNDLVGTWEGIISDGWYVENGEREEESGVDISDERYELRSDMTFDFFDKANGSWHISETGKWSFSNGTIKLYYYYAQENIYDDDPDVFKILEISDKDFTWEYHWKESGDEIYQKASYRKIK